MAKKRIFLTVLLISTIFLSILLVFFSYQNKILPNIYVAGVYLGDKTKNEALNLLQNNYKVVPKIILNINGKKSELLTSEIITSVDYQKSVDRAYNYPFDLSLLFKPVNLSFSLKFDEEKLLETILITTESMGSKPIFPSASKVDGQVIINKGKDGVEVDFDKARSDIGLLLTLNNTNEVVIKPKSIKTELTEQEILKYKEDANKLLNKIIVLKSDYGEFEIKDIELISYLTPNGFSDELIKTKITKISQELNRSPQDSVFVVNDGKVEEFVPSLEGVVVDENLLLEEIKKLSNEINIPIVKVEPKIKNSDINNLGIKTLIGKGTSSFRGSIANRIHNVNLAQSKFKGVLVPPKEIFSFNDILGDVSKFTGYKEAYVIKDGKTVLGDGGGVCQVSTTLFRAVLNTGLPVIERRAHAYRVGYYEQASPVGLDATVYSPTTDFKFKNDTPAYLLIQPTIDLKNLTLKFEIYGTNDGRIATISKPIITSSVAPAEDLYVDDPTLPVGTIKQIEHKAWGAKVIFDYKVKRSEEVLIDQKFVSNYRPWQAVYLRGTAQ